MSVPGNNSEKPSQRTEFNYRSQAKGMELKRNNEIDLLELFHVLMGKLHLIVFWGLLFAVICNSYAYFFVQPTYESTAKLYVVSASEDSEANISDLNAGSLLTSDYEELMLSYAVLEQVIDKLELKLSYEQVAAMIRIQNPSDTRVLNVTVTSTDPALAKDIANALADVAVEYLPRTMGIIKPNIAQEARLATARSGPSYKKYTMMGAMLGIILCCGWFVLKNLLDDTIKTPEDMEKYFGVVPLTVIPDASAVGGKKSAGKSRKKKGKKRRSEVINKNRSKRRA